MGSYVDSFAQRTDAQLVTLFELRPDLANPSPANIPSLAARASNSTSIARALASLNARTLQVLESALILHSLGESVTLDRLQGAFAAQDPGTAQAIAAEVDTLCACALLWQDSDILAMAPGLMESLDRFPAGFGPLSAHDVATTPVPHNAPAMARKIVDTLLWGPPVAVVARALFSTHPASDEPESYESLRWLLHNGYLEVLDDTHVYLPRQTAFALRGGKTHRELTVPPLSHVSASLTPASVQAEAARHATEVVRLIGELVALWEQEPAQSLRNGGLPVRELKRVANELDVSNDQAVLIVEMAFAARLVRSRDDGAHDFAPTIAVDAWLDADLSHRWSHLVQGWLVSARTPWRVGQPDSKGVALNALHPELHTQWVPRLRATILDVLKSLPLTAVSTPTLQEHLAWQAPRATLHSEAIDGLMREAEFLGVTGSGSLLPGIDEGSLAAALDLALPEPVNEIFIQGDLTGMVPGRPSTPLETLLEACAVAESRGGALTVRFTTESITHAFDTGYGATSLLEDLEAFSVTPLPQPLRYLVSDVARRHGHIRVGAVSSYIRLPDEVAARGLLSLPSASSIGLFQIAPTVLGASAPITQVLVVLREAGLAPAIEGPDGQVIAADRQTQTVRLPARSIRGNFESHGGISTPLPGESALRDLHAVPLNARPLGPATAHLRALVADIRSEKVSHSDSGNVEADSHVESGEPTQTKSQPTDSGETGLIVVNLREAIAAGNLVSIALADSSGKLTHRVLRPLTLESGRLRARDPQREVELTIAIHRIASVTGVN